MTDHQKETIWITIPDETDPTSRENRKSASKAPTDKVKNKAFWGAGFAALVVFIILLFVPKEFTGLMKAQLFDGTFKVVPDFEVQTGTLFGQENTLDSETTGATATTTGTSGGQNVVEAESEAVTIQIDPVTDPNSASSDTTSGGTTSTTTSTTTTTTSTDGTADTSGADDGDGTESDNGVLPVTADSDTTPDEGTLAGSADELDINSQLLLSLSQQLEDFKEKQRQSDQQIQDLMQLLEDQAAGLRPSAGTSTQTGTGGGIPTNGMSGAGSMGGVYRYNTHTVTVSPYDILAQNQAFQSQKQSYQANTAYAGVQAYSNQTYNAVLSGVQGQPDTGPAEVMLFAFALASFGVLLWGVARAVKA